MKNSKANQVATFEKLLGFCNAQSAVYKPSKVSIQLAALNTLLTQTQTMTKAADVSHIAHRDAINARKAGFSTLNRTASRIVDALVASGASPESIAEVRAIRRRFSSRAKVLVSPASTTLPDGQAQGEPVYTRRLSHLDMASKVRNFETLVHRVSIEPLYKPNEVDLTIAALTTSITQLRTQNKKVIATFEAMQNANRALHTALYGANGIYGIGREVKAYIRSVFGRGSNEHKAIAMFNFKKGR